MGNSVSPCFQVQNSESSSVVKLIFWEGNTKILSGTRHIAGEIMFESPDKMVCHADSFFIGHPIPVLAIDDELTPGQTYFVLPIDLFACQVLSVSSLASLNSSSPNNKSSGAAPVAAPINFCQNRPFEYIKGENGRVLIKVVPEFIVRLINRGKLDSDESLVDFNASNDSLCSTPELKRHYNQLVGSREQVWSPKLETISEHIKNNIRFSPCRFIGLEWKQKEKTNC